MLSFVPDMDKKSMSLRKMVARKLPDERRNLLTLSGFVPCDNSNNRNDKSKPINPSLTLP